MNLDEIEEAVARWREEELLAWKHTIIVHPSRERAMVESIEMLDPRMHVRVLTSKLVEPGNLYIVDDSEIEDLEDTSRFGFMEPISFGFIEQELAHRLLAQSVVTAGRGFRYFGNA